MKYKGNYIDFEKPVVCDNLPQLKEHIENSGGYKGSEGDEFRDYETASIEEFNIIGRRTAQYYFSMKDKKWHRSKNEITSYFSWSDSFEPLRSIAQFTLKKLGYKEKEAELIKKAIKERNEKQV